MIAHWTLLRISQTSRTIFFSMNSLTESTISPLWRHTIMETRSRWIYSITLSYSTRSIKSKRRSLREVVFLVKKFQRDRARLSKIFNRLNRLPTLYSSKSASISTEILKTWTHSHYRQLSHLSLKVLKLTRVNLQEVLSKKLNAKRLRTSLATRTLI